MNGMKNDKQVEKNPTLWRSTIIAARGFLMVFRRERKVRFAFIATFIFVSLAILVKASYIEVFLIFSAWIQVIVGEIFNTSLEKAMDYASGREFHPLIKLGKDYAAGSVFVLSVLASCLSLFVLGVRFFG